jgi:aspartyl-tRNA(Asn)/glutamyl-tRNA(Gln) amidotransferase subunit A
MGVYGLKPTNGSLSLDGVFPLSHSLDTVGPIAGSLEDLETVCRSLFQPEGGDFLDLNTLRIGFPESLWAFEPTVDRQLLDEMANLRKLLSSNGLHVVNIKLPPLSEYQHTGWTILNYEAYHTHASILEEKSAQCGEMFIQHMEAGRAISDEEYSNAKAKAHELAISIDDALKGVDILVSPIAYRLLPGLEAVDDIELYNASAIRIPFNLSGHPSLVTPLPLAQVGVPFAVQWVTRRFFEAMYFSPAFQSIDELIRTSRHCP